MFKHSAFAYAVVGISAAFLLALDRFCKLLALQGSWEGRSLLPGVLDFSFAQNYGIAFSLPLGGVWIWFPIALLILGLVTVFVFLAKQGNLQSVFLLAVILGASSNLWDRLNYGFVIDYLDLRYFTVFNLADVLIVGGAALLIFFEIKNTRPNRAEKRGGRQASQQ